MKSEVCSFKLDTIASPVIVTRHDKVCPHFWISNLHNFICNHRSLIKFTSLMYRAVHNMSAKFREVKRIKNYAGIIGQF